MSEWPARHSVQTTIFNRVAEATETNYIRSASLINRGIKFASAESADEIELNFERKSFVLWKLYLNFC